MGRRIGNNLAPEAGSAGTAKASPGLTPRQLQSGIDLVERTVSGLGPYTAAIRSGQVPTRQLGVIYLSLRNLVEVVSHQLRNARGNKVYMHADGHRQAVVDEKGQYVKDGFNDAAYLYFTVREQPLLHFTYDVFPWLALGRTRIDPTSKAERIYAFMGDLEYAILKGRGERSALDALAASSWSSPGEITALAVFLEVIQLGKATEVFEWFASDDKIETVDILRVMKALHAGFLQAFQVS
jgi:hypothetical protein